MRLFLISVLSLLLPIAPASAKVLTWECKFDQRTDLDGVANETFELTFKIDTTSQKAYMQGNAGISELDMHIGDDAFSFVEKISSGAVQATTITRDGLAIHSRNTVISGQFVAAQHHGRCRSE